MFDDVRFVHVTAGIKGIYENVCSNLFMDGSSHPFCGNLLSFTFEEKGQIVLNSNLFFTFLIGVKLHIIPSKISLLCSNSSSTFTRLHRNNVLNFLHIIPGGVFL